MFDPAYAGLAEYTSGWDEELDEIVAEALAEDGKCPECGARKPQVSDVVTDEGGVWIRCWCAECDADYDVTWANPHYNPI